MNRSMVVVTVLAVTVSALFCGAVWAAETVMGKWEGEWVSSVEGGGKLTAQVIAEGDGNYRAVLEAYVGEAEPVRGTMQGKREGDRVEFKGTVDAGEALGGVYNCTGQVVGEKFTGRYSGQDDQGRFEMRRVLRLSPTLGAKPPEGAVVLFDGKDLSKWVTKDNKPNPWSLVEGAMEIFPGKGEIMTRDEFGDFKLHLEFWIPLEEKARGQGRGNSGVFLPGNCEEVQILDSFGLEPDNGSCGAIYAQAPPGQNACLPPEEWQTYDITCLVPRFDEKGNMIRKTILTVHHNGALIHDRFPAKRKTGRRHGDDFRRILLQDHGSPLRFRNIWLVPLKSE